LRRSVTESSVYEALTMIIDVIFVGLIWFVVSLPVITIGPASTALYYSVSKCIRRGRGRIGATFFSSFKSNFRQGTVIWLIYMAYVALGIADFCALRMLGVPDASLLGNLSKLFFLPAVLTLPWVFAFLSRFENTVKGTLKFVGYLTLRHIGRTLLLTALLVGCAVMAWLMPPIAWLLPAVCCLAMSYVIEPVFKAQTENKEEDNNADPWYNE